MRKQKAVWQVVLVVAILAIAAQVGAARLPVKPVEVPRFMLQTLGPTNAHGFVMGLNNKGQAVVCGWKEDGDHGYVVTPKTALFPIDLGVGSSANGINNRGAVCGQQREDDGSLSASHSLKGGPMLPICFPVDTDYAIANAINNPCDIVGGVMVYQQWYGNITPFFLRHGSKIPKMLPGGSGSAFCNNDSGLIGGVQYCSGPAWSKAVIWQIDENGAYQLKEVPLPDGAIRGCVEAMNSSGDLSGYAVNYFEQVFACSWSLENGIYKPCWLPWITQANGIRGLSNTSAGRNIIRSSMALPQGTARVDDLGRPISAVDPGMMRFQTNAWVASSDGVSQVNSWAMGINSKGQIVGADANRALLWQKGQVYDLNALVDNKKFLVFAAMAINDKGQIAARAYCYRTGCTVPILLDPISKR